MMDANVHLPSRRSFMCRHCTGSALVLGAVGAVFGQAASDHEKSVTAFKQIAQVMRSPRCMNCHTITEFPLQGDAARRHDQGVTRGEDGKGTAPMQCAACHRDTNSPDGYVPGAPEWHLAPVSMSWERARGNKDLCEGLLDKTRNGNREAKGIVIHMVNDALVQWAWAPGRGRTPPPISQEAFH
jgi:mono/diheme cytochrome c family protein